MKPRIFRHPEKLDYKAFQAARDNLSIRDYSLNFHEVSLVPRSVLLSGESTDVVVTDPHNIEVGKTYYYNKTNDLLSTWDELISTKDIDTDDFPCFKGFESFFEPGWDGFDADPVDKAVLEAACKIVRSLPSEFHNPDAAPAADGSVCMEWIFDDGQEIFIDTGPSELVLVYAKFHDEEPDSVRFESYGPAVEAYIKRLFRNLRD